MKNVNYKDFLHNHAQPFSVLSLEVSKCSEEIKNYIEERSGEDPLVKGVPEDKNPFKEKGGCVIA
uniref:Guanine nucleotide-binding protein subunit gamma n=1 Tax=Malurus cyaneus samueli TaxID=2593467 RepID=A0A8C5TK75_9PASS